MMSSGMCIHILPPLSLRIGSCQPSLCCTLCINQFLPDGRTREYQWRLSCRRWTLLVDWCPLSCRRSVRFRRWDHWDGRCLLDVLGLFSQVFLFNFLPLPPSSQRSRPSILLSLSPSFSPSSTSAPFSSILVISSSFTSSSISVIFFLFHLFHNCSSSSISVIFFLFHLFHKCSSSIFFLFLLPPRDPDLLYSCFSLLLSSRLPWMLLFLQSQLLLPLSPLLQSQLFSSSFTSSTIVPLLQSFSLLPLLQS